MSDVYGSPRGECYRWSMNLASLLLETGFQEVYIVNGEIRIARGVSASHSWLECGAYVIDITADQFNGLSTCHLPEVIVCPRKASPFHRPKSSRLLRERLLF